jgi:hypothetical protein
MRKIVLIEDLKIGERIVDSPTGPKIMYDTFAAKGTTVRKHKDGRVDFFLSAKDGATATFPISSKYVCDKVWRMAMSQYRKKLRMAKKGQPAS